LTLFISKWRAPVGLIASLWAGPAIAQPAPGDTPAPASVNSGSAAPASGASGSAVSGSAAPASAAPDKAIVLTDSGLSITGLKQRYARAEPIELTVAVPRQNVLRARTEVALMRDDTRGQPIYQDLRDYDRFTHVESLKFNIRLPAAERQGQLALLVRVRGLRNRGEGTPAEAFEDALTYRLGFEAEAGGGAVVDQGSRLDGRAFFGFNAAKIDSKASAQADRWADALKAADGLAEIRIEGHADKTGGSGYNLELSRRRAEAVRAALISRGIRRGIIRVVGFGFDRPAAANGASPALDEKGVWQNRRAEVVWFSARRK
jgi:outer membrane protein OmpA-like peptidoglycan-associated protein